MMGVATYIHTRTIAMNLISFDDERGIDVLELTNILTSLPPDTRLVRIEELPVQTLFIEYKFTLSNPIFKDGGVIKDTKAFTRQIANKNGHLYEFNQSPLFDLSDALNQDFSEKKSQE